MYIEKDIHKLFKSINLKIVLELNQTQEDFLDVTMNNENKKKISLIENQIVKSYISIKIQTTLKT